MSLPQFKLLRPKSVSEASRVLELARRRCGRNPILAGGTDLIPSMRQKLFEPEYVLDLRGIIAMRRASRHSPMAASKLALSPLCAQSNDPAFCNDTIRC